MPTPIGYFYYPFANAGDTTPIPIPTQGSGAISYDQGYGPDYELDLLTNPEAQPVGRTTMNQLFYDITSQLQQYSQYGTPPFITSSQNQGTAYAYPIYARTYYMGVVYENQVASNTATPGTDDTWLVLSGDATGVLTGTILDFGGIVVPAGYLGCDGSAVLRTTYAPLLAVISQTQTGTTTNGVNTVSGLTNATTTMYVGMDIESANFSPGTTIASIVDANNITVTPVAIAGGAVSIQFFNWGNGDGSTTFNVPDLRRNTTIGQGGMAYAGPPTVGQITTNVVGSGGGQEAHDQTVPELVPHTHQFTYYSGDGVGGTILSGYNESNIDPTTVTTTSTGGSNPFNVMQPSMIVVKMIKT